MYKSVTYELTMQEVLEAIQKAHPQIKAKQVCKIRYQCQDIEIPEEGVEIYDEGTEDEHEVNERVDQLSKPVHIDTWAAEVKVKS